MTRLVTRRTLRPLHAAAAVLVAMMLLAACGDDDTAETTATPTTAAAAETVTVTAVDYAFVDLPDRVAAGTTLSLQNDSDGEVHELVAVLLPDDENRSAADLIQLPAEEMAEFFPLAETVVIAPPGQSGSPVLGTGTLTEPGRYLVFCAIPTGADPDEYLAAAAESEGPPDVEGGPPHFTNGMFGEVTVEG